MVGKIQWCLSRGQNDLYGIWRVTVHLTCDKRAGQTRSLDIWSPSCLFPPGFVEKAGLILELLLLLVRAPWAVWHSTFPLVWVACRISGKRLTRVYHLSECQDPSLHDSSPYLPISLESKLLFHVPSSYSLLSLLARHIPQTNRNFHCI